MSVVCNQTGRKLLVLTEFLSKDDGALEDDDLYVGSQLMHETNGKSFPVTFIEQPKKGTLYTHTVFPRIVRARSINFSLSKLRAIIEGALYSRARSISNQHWLNKQMPS